MSISYSQRGKKNLWTYRIFDKTGKQLASKGGFKTKTEAKQEAIPLESKLISGLTINKNISLYHLWEQWYQLHILPQGKMQSTLNKHLKRGQLIDEYFKNIPLRDIKASQYQDFINTYAQTNCRDNVSRLNSEVKKILDFARQDKIDFHDFTIGVKLSGKPATKTKEERYINSKSDYVRLLDYLHREANYKDSTIPYLLYIQLKTGLRFGEVLGLTWDCIKWKTKEIYTYRRYDSVYQKWTKAKTPESVRYIPIDDDTINMLHRIQKEQHQVTLHNPENMLFVNLIYGVPSNKACNKHLQNILEELNIFPQNMTCTGNRHTYASILLSEDIDIWAIAKNMGHKDIKQITETYGHLIKEKAEQENNKVRQALFNLRTS